jgi:hypothetical protein
MPRETNLSAEQLKRKIQVQMLLVHITAEFQ